VSERPPKLQSTDHGEGPVVVLVHGQPGQAADWRGVAEALESGHRVFVPDRPGYGRTGGSAVGVAANADAVGRLLDDNGVESATVVGHSFGGGVALALAQRRAELVGGLVLVGSVGTASSLGPQDRVLGLPVLGDGLAFAGFEASRWLLPALRRRSTRLPPALASWLRAVPEPGPAPHRGRAPSAATWRSFVTEQRALLAETPELEAGLSSVRAPTAVVAGRRDRVVPAQAAADLAEAIPGAELVWVPDAGHLVPQEAPRVLVDIVRRYASGR
jgi:pimeloyl-ACP methyl ester carboxylesterase